MSAPDTNLEKNSETDIAGRARRHRWSLMGMAGVIAFVLVLFIGLITYVTYQGNTPGTDQVDGQMPRAELSDAS